MQKVDGKGPGMENKKVLLDAETIRKRISQIGMEISHNYAGEDLLIIGILKGCFMFMADLVRAIDVPTQIDFVRISSYGSGTESSGKLEIKMDISTSVAGRNVLLVDDIVDTGLTLSEYYKRLASLGPKKLETAALINKTGRREKFVKLDYCCFDVESGFLVGYGLDFDEQYRCLGSLYVLD
jgi:hypoxanthine phosphoribosyltransferase